MNVRCEIRIFPKPCLNYTLFLLRNSMHQTLFNLDLRGFLYQADDLQEEFLVGNGSGSTDLDRKPPKKRAKIIQNRQVK